MFEISSPQSRQQRRSAADSVTQILDCSNTTMCWPLGAVASKIAVQFVFDMGSTRGVQAQGLVDLLHVTTRVRDSVCQVMGMGVYLLLRLRLGTEMYCLSFRLATHQGPALEEVEDENSSLL